MTKLNAYGSSHAFQSAAARCATSFLRKLAVVEDVEVEPLFRGAAAYFFVSFQPPCPRAADHGYFMSLATSSAVPRRLLCVAAPEGRHSCCFR